MKQEAILIEAVTLADEILERGPHGGRGIRLAALVQRLNEAMVLGEVPLSWRPPVPLSEVMASLRPPPLPPATGEVSMPRGNPALDWSDFRADGPDDLPDPDELDAAWDRMLSQPETQPSRRPRISLAPPEFQPGSGLDGYEELDDGDFEIV